MVPDRCAGFCSTWRIGRFMVRVRQSGNTRCIGSVRPVGSIRYTPRFDGTSECSRLRAKLMDYSPAARGRRSDHYRIAQGILYAGLSSQACGSGVQDHGANRSGNACLPDGSAASHQSATGHRVGMRNRHCRRTGCHPAPRREGRHRSEGCSCHGRVLVRCNVFGVRCSTGRTIRRWCSVMRLSWAGLPLACATWFSRDSGREVVDFYTGIGEVLGIHATWTGPLPL